MSIVKGGLVPALKDFPKLNLANLRYGYSAQTTAVAVRDDIRAALPDVLLVAADDIFAELGWVKEKDCRSELVKVNPALMDWGWTMEKVWRMLPPIPNPM